MSGKTIDILVAIDANRILANPNQSNTGTPDNPVALIEADKVINMIVDPKYVADGATGQQGEAGSELSIKANVGDSLHFRATSLSTRIVNLTPYVYQVNFWSHPDSFTSEVYSYGHRKPLPSDPSGKEFQLVDAQDYAWKIDIKSNPGEQVAYSFCFTLVNTEGETMGSYYWDPYITVVGS